MNQDLGTDWRYQRWLTEVHMTCTQRSLNLLHFFFTDLSKPLPMSYPSDKRPGQRATGKVVTLEMHLSDDHKTDTPAMGKSRTWHL
jgi:hypothetical protein